MSTTSERAEGPSSDADIMFWARVYAPLLPCILGFACMRIGAAFTLGGLYMGTDRGVYTDGPNVVSLVLFALVGIVMFRTGFVFRKRLVNRVLLAAVLVHALAIVAMVATVLAGVFSPSVRFGLLCVVSFAATVCTLYWLRRMRGASMATGAVMILASLIGSELVVFAISFVPDPLARSVVSSLFALCQIPCARWARTRPRAYQIDVAPSTRDHYAFVQQGVATPRFLAASAAGIAALALVVGFLRGYPSGDPVALTPTARVLALVLTEGIFLGLLVAVLRGKSSAMSVGMWIVMELLAACSLVLYCMFHGHLEYGAALVSALNSVMSAFVWHVIIAFMTYGKRDPFYYGIVVWCLWMAARSIGRFVPFSIGLGYSADSHLAGTIVSLALLVSTQFTFVKLTDVAVFSARMEERELCRGRIERALAESEELSKAAQDAGIVAPSHHANDASSADATPAQGTSARAHAMSALSAADERRVKGGAFERLLGLDDAAGIGEVREALLSHSAEVMGKQFLLSDREVEVLSLYASGMTQKRVAERLHISTTTAHTHITRIYAKTGLHSRQEILDYMREHVEGPTAG